MTVQNFQKFSQIKLPAIKFFCQEKIYSTELFLPRQVEERVEHFNNSFMVGFTLEHFNNSFMVGFTPEHFNNSFMVGYTLEHFNNSFMVGFTLEHFNNSFMAGFTLDFIIFIRLSPTSSSMTRWDNASTHLFYFLFFLKLTEKEGYKLLYTYIENDI